MQISISFNLSDAKILNIAKDRGYTPTVTVLDGNNVVGEVPNPLTPGEFVKNLFQEMMKHEMKKSLISDEEKEARPQKLLKEKQISDLIDSSFS